MARNESVVDFLGKKTKDILQKVKKMNPFSRKGSIMKSVISSKISYPVKGDLYSYPDLFRINMNLKLAASPKVGAVTVLYKDHNEREILRSRKAFLISRTKNNKNFVLIFSDYDYDPTLVVLPEIAEFEEIDLITEKKTINDFWVLMRCVLIHEPNSRKLTSHIVVPLL